ncbi:DUF1569 domain-containing protein [Planctomyces sp. SH-PL62]|uniref:DUF1569 domain-containing protein n=1 Tax=Planctomyces sp. SH-PL62 TaxID=1636152 RepID=UPI00078BDF1B|nr:DUF1569 domain-containing protein [Planctomyces sp. SH-PL62]AMV35813.1 hypothetical protein VT85_00115 [Planctomyces sp. SH-PL62]
MSTEPKRRELKFSSLDEAVRDAESLRERGYTRLGRWGLAQACGHLADWITFPMDGFPAPPTLLRPFLFVARHTVGPLAARRVLAKGEMPAGAPTMKETVPDPGGDEAQAIDRLRRAVERFEASTGPYQPSHLFGRLDRDEWMRLQLIHCAHHLGFLRPDEKPRD